MTHACKGARHLQLACAQASWFCPVIPTFALAELQSAAPQPMTAVIGLQV